MGQDFPPVKGLFPLLQSKDRLGARHHLTGSAIASHILPAPAQPMIVVDQLLYACPDGMSLQNGREGLLRTRARLSFHSSEPPSPPDIFRELISSTNLSDDYNADRCGTQRKRVTPAAFTPGLCPPHSGQGSASSPSTAWAGPGTVRATHIAPSAHPWASGLPKRSRHAGARR